MATVFTVTSGKGGVGKSSLSAGLGIALARRGKKVLLIDCDAGLRSLDLLLNLSEKTMFDLGDVLAQRCTPSQAVYAVPQVKQLFLIPAPAQAGVLDDAACLQQALQLYQEKCDIIILDAPAGIDAAFDTTVACADLVLTVATADPVCLRDAGKVAQLIAQKGKNARLLINKMDLSLIRKGKLPNMDESIDAACLQLVGIVPYDPKVLLAAVQGKVLRKGQAAAALDRIAGRLLGEKIRLPKAKKI
ncbi:MAG: AAA family ATPase [Clostridia bacterium]|nr:AAA family ATPase [Clostridia bacterium]